MLLAQQIRAIDPQAQFEGIGGARMIENGFSLWRDHRGWATFGPFEAIPRIRKMLAEMYAAANHIAATKPDRVVLVDFGAFNIRLARQLRRLGYANPIVDIFPPSAWMDREKAARAVSQVALPVTAFEHQRDFFRSLGLPVWYFGHPLAGSYEMRAARPAPDREGGAVALLPGSRGAELRNHVPLLADAFKLLQRERPQLQAVAGAASAAAVEPLAKAFRAAGVERVKVVEGARAALLDADAAFVASGTAVLECALLGVPCVAFYKLSPLLAIYGRMVYRGRFITIPNLVLQREAVPELLQEHATPMRLAHAMDKVLSDPQAQYRSMLELRSKLGPADAMHRIAAFVAEGAG